MDYEKRIKELVRVASTLLASNTLVPVTDSDVWMSEKEFYEKKYRSIRQAKEGKVLKVSSDDDLKKLLYD